MAFYPCDGVSEFVPLALRATDDRAPLLWRLALHKYPDSGSAMADPDMQGQDEREREI